MENFYGRATLALNWLSKMILVHVAPKNDIFIAFTVDVNKYKE